MCRSARALLRGMSGDERQVQAGLARRKQSHEYVEDSEKLENTVRPFSD